MSPQRKTALFEALFAALALVLGTVTIGCGPSIYETYDYGKEYDPRRHEYVIGVADTVQVSVYHAPELSGSATVRPDGVIAVPLLGDVSVAGKTPTAVSDELKARFTAYIKADTMVNVTVTGFGSYRFIVTGNVNHPGALNQRYYVTVSEAVAMAGGPNRFAGDKLEILRLDSEGHLRKIPISYDLLVSGRRPEQDICVVARDVIVVP